MSEQILKEILSELREVKSDIRALKEGQEFSKTELKKDIKDVSCMIETFGSRFDTIDSEIKSQEFFKTELKKDIKDVSCMIETFGSRFDTIDSEIAGIHKKLDRQIAVSRSNSAKLRELEIRVEDLEVSPPIK